MHCKYSFRPIWFMSVYQSQHFTFMLTLVYSRPNTMTTLKNVFISISLNFRSSCIYSVAAKQSSQTQRQVYMPIWKGSAHLVSVAEPLERLSDAQYRTSSLYERRVSRGVDGDLTSASSRPIKDCVWALNATRQDRTLQSEVFGVRISREHLASR